MKPSHDLFDLVKSLTKNEKRYVSLFLSTSFHGSNKNSLRLFRSVAKQDEYDEPALKQQLGKAFSTRFSAEKNKLFELILESMLLYYRDRTEEKKVNTLRYHAGFLFSKSLRNAGWRYLDKAKNLSEAHELFANSIQLSYRENLEVRKSAPGELNFDAEKFRAHNAQMIQSLGEDQELYSLYTEIAQIEKRYGSVPPSKKVTAELERIMQHPLMDPERKLNAFSARLSRLEIRAMYFRITCDEEKVFESCDEQVRLFEASPAKIAFGYGRYSDALLNRLQSVAVLRKHELFDKLLPQTRKALDGIRKFLGFHIDFIQFYGPDSLELTALTNRADTKRGPAFLTYIEKRLKQYRSQMRVEEMITMLYLIGTYHFYLGNLKKALTFYNDLTDSTSADIAQNYQCMVRQAKLLLHYELGHTDLLASLAASASRLLEKHGRLGAYEKALLTFFRKEPERGDKVPLKILHEQLLKLNPGQHNYGLSCEFDIRAWVESQLEKKPLYEMVQKYC